MSALSKFIFANSNQNYFGAASPFGDPRDVYINGVNEELTTAIRTGQGQTFQSSSILVGNTGNDYLGAYNWTADEVDILVGGLGADIFVAGDISGIHYLNVGVSVVADYDYYGGDFVQLSSLGSGGYTYQVGNFGLGTEVADMVFYYNGDPIMALADAPQVNYYFV